MSIVQLVLTIYNSVNFVKSYVKNECILYYSFIDDDKSGFVREDKDLKLSKYFYLQKT